MNIYNLCLLLGASLLISVIFQLKKKYYAFSTGDYSGEERKGVQFARKISKDEFERQKRDYTQRQVEQLMRSQEFQKRMQKKELSYSRGVENSRLSMDFRST